MRLSGRSITGILMCLATASALGADGWKGPGEITAVQPEIYRQNDLEGSFPVVVNTTIPLPDCSTTQWVIRSDLDDGGRLYAAVLAAFTAGKRVELYQWSCIRLGGAWYGRVGAVKIVQ